jgi:hypothetical protein
MPDHSREDMEKMNTARKTAEFAGISTLAGFALFAVKLALKIYINQGIDNKIGALEATKAGLQGEFLGTWRHSEEINNIDSQISDLRGEYK